MSDSLRPYEPQHARPPCPSPTPGVYPNSCPLSQWCHPTISSSVVPFSSCPLKIILHSNIIQKIQVATADGNLARLFIYCIEWVLPTVSFCLVQKLIQRLFLWLTDVATVFCLQLHDLVIGGSGRVSTSFLEWIKLMCGYFLSLFLRQKVGVLYLIKHVSLIMLWLNQETEKEKALIQLINMRAGHFMLYYKL